jgi:hypothetical protein
MKFINVANSAKFSVFTGSCERRIFLLQAGTLPSIENIFFPYP